MNRAETGIFAPHRALGEVCTAVKPIYVYNSNKSQGFMFCAVGSVICIYLIQPFRLISVVSSLHSTVSLIAADHTYLFAVVENTISVFKRNGEQFVRNIIPQNAPKLLLPFSDALVVVDLMNGIEVFDVESGNSIVEIDLPPSFVISAMVHPITYVNQIVLGSEDGRIRLVNIGTGALVREFPSDENFNCKITVLEQSPAVDVLAIGMANGRIHLKNIKINRIICSFRQDGFITALSFRTDDIDSLVSGNSDGSIAIWDLNNKILIGQKTAMHTGPIVSLYFLLGQSFMVTSGADNRLVKWVLKDELSLPEIKAIIEGPSEPVTSASFYGTDSLLVASKDGCVRQVNTFHGGVMRNMGLGREVKKGDLSKDRFIDVHLNPIERMSITPTREAVWDNVICQHQDSPLVSTWSTRRYTQGAHLFFHKRFKNNPKYIAARTTSVYLSCCGNFAILGYSSGHLDIFNMQSGKYKHSFWYSPMAAKDTDEDDRTAHSSAVTGVVLDITNQNLVSGSADGSIHFWSFNPPKLLSRVVVAYGVSKFRLDKYNSLLGIALDNGDLAVVDILCRRVARLFKNSHVGCKVTALDFTHDGQWLVSADDKCMLKVWDLSTCSLIDAMKCSLVCIDISFNESDQYLATCHEGQRAVYFWANKSLFVAFTPSLLPVKMEPTIRECALPSLSAGSAAQINQASNDDEDDEICRLVVIDDDEEDDNRDVEIMSVSSYSAPREEIFVDKAQLEPQLLSLSGLAPARWANLPNLDLIRQRNKPIEPPKKQQNAPFFLPATETLEGFVFENMDVEKENLPESDKALMAKRKLNELETPWAISLLSAGYDVTELIKVFASLKEMNVSSIDFQIRALTFKAFGSFLHMLISVLELKQDFELVQSYLATFLNIHRDKLWNKVKLDIKEEDDEESNEEKDNQELLRLDEELTQALGRILQLQNETWTEVQSLLDANLSIAMWIKCSLV